MASSTRNENCRLVFASTLPHTNELSRIIGIARRSYTQDQLDRCRNELTSILRRPAGRQTLLPIQSLALLEIGLYGGLFGIIRVGDGKTLISLLAPIVARSTRPLLLIRANLREKTRLDSLRYAVDWRVAKYIRIESYSQLGRRQSAQLLIHYRPDLIISDECHHLRNLKNAACARRVARYMREFPSTKFVGMSGTIVNDSIENYAHLARWALKDNAPIPKPSGELMQWSDVLDYQVNPFRRVHPGAMIHLCNDDERRLWQSDPTRAARAAYSRRLRETPGVVCSEPTTLDCPLIVATKKIDLNRDLVSAFHTLRTRWRTPDDWPIADGLAHRRHAYELALGFYYYWDPRPPDDWMDARKAWCSECRSIISNSRSLDSESQVVDAIDRGMIRSSTLTQWREIRDTFTPNTKARWLSDQVIDYCTEWMKRPGIVWTAHTAFAERLALVADKPYYGKDGLNSAGQYIESASPNQACVASIASNSEGRNLQHIYSRALITAPPANALAYEQMFGRIHRPFQRAHEVTYDIILSCIEHRFSLERAIELSRITVQTTPGASMKLLDADKSFHTISELANIQKPQWQKTEA